MDVAPLPPVGIGMILGLLEMLEDVEGREDIFRLASGLSMELDDIGPVIEAASLLGLIEVSGGDIMLTDRGKLLLDADISGRKAIVAEQLRSLKLFQEVLQLLRSRKKRSLKRAQVIELFAQTMADEDAEQVFNTLVDWGRFAGIIAYDPQGETLYLNKT